MRKDRGAQRSRSAALQSAEDRSILGQNLPSPTAANLELHRGDQSGAIVNPSQCLVQQLVLRNARDSHVEAAAQHAERDVVLASQSS